LEISRAVRVSLAIVACVLLAGCANGQKGGVIEQIMSHRAMAKDQGPPTETVLAPQPALSMPTDLRLPPPAAAATDNTGAHERVKSDVLETPQSLAPDGEAQPIVDPYEAYGISRYNEDGTPKSQEELKKELHEAYLKRKRQSNPNYGTIFNTPNVFK
jgi:hypothetical protein